MGSSQSTQTGTQQGLGQSDTLRLAISATFERRRTPLPSDPPLALTTEFAADPQKIRQWDAFVDRIRGKQSKDY